MFIRDFKIRSNNQVKSSEKKGIIRDILGQFPSLSDEDLASTFKLKESEITLCKLETHDSTHVVVYLINKIPYFFKIEKQLQFIPTVYFLWRFPQLLPKFYTHKQVLNKLANGADLMLPGIITSEPVNMYTFKHIHKDQICALCLDNNDVPIAVGKSLLSGEDMYMSGMRGKCMIILHMHNDNLWSMGDRSLPVPNIPIQISKFDIKDSYQDNFPTLGSNNEPKELISEISKTSETTSDINIDSLRNLGIDEGDGDKVEEEESKLVDHEQILTECFKCAIKFKNKEINLPIIVSTFMKIMQSCCGPDEAYDLKKTRFKKMSTFLKEMESKGCIKLKDNKGVLSITSFSKDHEIFKYCKKPDWMKEVSSEEVKIDDLKYVFEIFEVYRVNGNIETFFRPKFKKNDIITSAEIRQLVTTYIKDNNLQLKEDPKYFIPNEDLVKIFLKKSNAEEKMTFEELFGHIFQKIPVMHQIKRVYKDRKIEDPSYLLRKGKFQPVEFKLENRGGNKKMTTVHNLATFEIDFQQLQQRLRKEIGCSVTLAEVETASVGASMIEAKEYVVNIQGNQINQIANILRDELGIQHKHMKGLDLGIKK